MSDDPATRLRELTFTPSKTRGGVIGQTTEAAMRSTFHEVSAFELHELAEQVEAINAALDHLRALLAEAREDLAANAELAQPHHLRKMNPRVNRKWIADMDLCWRIDAALQEDTPNG